MEMVPNPSHPSSHPQIPITNITKGIKLSGFKLIFLLNYCQYCLHGFLVKIALEYRGDSESLSLRSNLNKLKKGRREKGGGGA